MNAIFFDLETTDTNPIGQILNYCFIKVNAAFEPEAELSGDIRISRLQLPGPDAILANRTNVIDHQARASQSEREAMLEIATFIGDAVASSGDKTPLIGFNSNRFDLPFLRTSLIRNGINPYFGGKLSYRDLFHLAKKLYCDRADFPRAARKDDPSKLSLSLESLCKSFGLLDGAQTHHSRDDVLLTIELARLLRSRFGADVRAFEAYEAQSHHRNPRRGEVIACYHPGYDLAGAERRSSSPMTLLDASHRYALWIDLERFRSGAGERAISWFNPAIHYMFVDREWRGDATHAELARAALAKFEKVNLNNFFKPSVCDIEQDIYRVDFDGIEALRLAIWERKPDAIKAIKSRDAKVLLMRHQMAEHTFGQAGDDRIREMLKAYALYRYGGRANTAKSNLDEPFREGVYSDSYHVTFNELVERLEELLIGASPEDALLLKALERFYFESEIHACAGEDLAKIKRIRLIAA